MESDNEIIVDDDNSNDDNARLEVDSGDNSRIVDDDNATPAPKRQRRSASKILRQHGQVIGACIIGSEEESAKLAHEQSNQHTAAFSADARRHAQLRRNSRCAGPQHILLDCLIRI